MKKNFNVLILGKGKIGLAIFYYLKKLKLTKEVTFFENEKRIKNFNILVGALPSQVAKKSLKLALKYKKDLIDVSALPISFYLKHKKEINEKGLRVIPGCGFSPGLVNFICGFESKNFNKINNIEISTGTLPKNKKFFFPFTWCFEDLINQHLSSASIIKNGKKINLPPFSDHKKEKLKEIGEFESYLIEEWNSLFYSLKPKNISFRVIRPIGFFHFFQYLKNYGFLKKENFAFTKEILVKTKVDNITLAIVKISGGKNCIWEIFSLAKAKEKFNSMQKITAIVPAIMIKFFLNGKIENKGLIFMEDLGKNKILFKEILKEIKREKIFFKKFYL